MEELADATGGRYFHNNNDLKGGFEQVAAAPEFVYVLGFSPQNLKLDGTYHSLKVTLKTSRGLDLAGPARILRAQHLPDPEEDAKREIQEALFSRDECRTFRSNCTCSSSNRATLPPRSPWWRGWA